jgi:glycosyltransferase involved in cell wall biosynthesis
MARGTPAADDRLVGLRVLGFCDYFTESSSGGAEKVTAEVYSRLQAQGAQITVLSATPGNAGGATTVHGIPTRVVPAIDLAKMVNAQVTLAPRLLGTARRLIDELHPQVLHATSVHFQGSRAAALLARRRRLPLVTTGHVAAVSRLPLATRTATTVYEHTAGRFILRASSRVIAVSESVATHLRQLGAPGDRTVVVHNGVDHNRFCPRPRDLDRPQVVFVGRLIQNKGPADALNAFAAAGVPGAQLTFVGHGPMRDRLEADGARLGLNGAVHFTGHLDDVSAILGAADVLVRPSRTEGQSLAILEAMAAGVCVLASDIPANRELVDDGRSGLLAAVGDTQGLARRLRRLLTDHPFRDRLAAQGRRRAQQHSWEACARDTGLVLADAAHDG